MLLLSGYYYKYQSRENKSHIRKEFSETYTLHTYYNIGKRRQGRTLFTGETKYNRVSRQYTNGVHVTNTIAKTI